MSGTVSLPIPTVPVFDTQSGQINLAWYQFFNNLVRAGGGSSSTAGGDLSGTYPNPTVARIKGASLGSTNPTSGNLLIANGTAWDTKPMSGDATIDQDGVVTVTGAAPTGAAGGDLGGTYPNPTVDKINTVALGTTTATAGNLLIGSGTAWVTHAVSGDAMLTSAGALTVTQVNAVAYPAAPATGTVPLVTAINAVAYTATTGTGNVVRATTPTIAGATISVDNGLKFTSQTSDAGANTGTLTNSPTTGNPAFWLRITINGTNYAIPAWTA